MVNLREIPLIIMMLFTLVYSIIGNPDDPMWSAAYFFVNYATMLVLFRAHKSKTIRLIGISLSLSIIIFIVLKYFIKADFERYYTLVPFSICLIGLIIIDRKKNESSRRKDI